MSDATVADTGTKTTTTTTEPVALAPSPVPTADKTDLRAIPFLGNVAVFIGGLQRMAWSYGVLYLDFMVFSGAWAITGGTLQSTFWIMNFLVLGVLFGERALMNVVPLLTVLLQARQPVK